jgi:RimJ/RimL family protein N-acetyltransferase
MTSPVLTTDRLRLTRPQHVHLSAFADFYASPRAAARGWLRTADDARAFWDHLDNHWAQRGFGWFVIQESASNNPIGMCGPWTDSVMPEAEIAWSLWYDDVEGKGLAFEAASAVRDFAFNDLGWTTAVSYIAYDNLRSIALARRLGASQDGEWTTPKGVRVATYRHLNPGAPA